jgi:hypothetical protein
VACDRALVVDDAHREPGPAETAHDPEPLVVAAYDDRTELE